MKKKKKKKKKRFKMFKIGDDVVFIKGESHYDKRVWKIKRLTKLKDQVLLSRPVGGRMWQPIELLRKATKEEVVLQKRVDQLTVEMA